MKLVRTTFDKDDLKKVYDEYFGAVRNFLYYKTKDIQLAEDLVQEVFIKVWEKRETIKKETLKSLLYTIANNLMINHINHQKVVRSHEDSSNYQVGSSESPEYIFEEQEFQIRFNLIMSKIPDGPKEVFLMNRIEDLKYDEIASRLELSVKAVEKRMSKALSILREELGRKI